MKSTYYPIDGSRVILYSEAKMENDRIAALMKYVRGEISFSEWIESGAGSADVEDENETQDGNGDDQGDGEAGGLQTTEVNTLSEERSQPTGVENV